MTRESNIAALERFNDAVDRGDFQALDEVVAPGAIDHDPAPGQAPGLEGIRQFFTGLHTSFPDLKISVEQVVADGDYVAIAYTITGTQQGRFLGLAPTGKHIQARGVEIGKFANGKLIERWGSSDQLGILQQLGLMSSFSTN
ncbi:MAG: ester cyclase [Ktedonobacteraceae bacterium]|nr:ester cyclase [Ktedonobacteraceae bacterium]